MSIKGLLESEKKAASIQRHVLSSLRAQQRELRDEIAKTKYLLGDKTALVAWRTSLAKPERIISMRNMLGDIEKLYLEAGDTQAARIFKARMEVQLRKRLTNLKANELEVKLRVEHIRASVKPKIVGGLSDIGQEAAIGELYAQSRNAGGFLVSSGRPYMADLVTLETKAAGSKTLGEYMTKLFNDYETKLKDVFVKGIVRGDSYQRMEKNLMDTSNITAGKAKLLVRTEANAIFNESIRGVITNNPLVKGYRFRAVLDGRTSSICRSHDGDYIPKDKVKPGVNFPPLHPNCRSTVMTVLYNQDERKDISQRYTKNGSNAWIPVPPGTTYSKYKQLFEDYIRHSTTSSVNDVAREVYIKPGDGRMITTSEGLKIIPNVAASAVLIDGELSQSVNPQIKALYDRAKRVEPTITEAMVNIAETENTKLAGLEFSVKTASSVESKLLRKTEGMLAEAAIKMPSQEEVASNFKDLIRYTVVAEHDDIPRKTMNVMNSLEDRGMRIIGLDNKYLDKDPKYKGVHIDCEYQGQKFEIQVHSQESLEVQGKSHMLFKKSRELVEGDEIREQLEVQMKTLARGLRDPRGVKSLRSFRRE